MFEIKPATPEDREGIRQLQGLCPYPGVPARGESIHFVARSDNTLIGAAGMEVLDGEAALVRILAVIPGYRKRQVARQLLLRLVAFGGEKGIPNLYAPGLYAAEYFSRFGFAPCPTAELPACLQGHPFPGIEKFTGKLMRRPLQAVDTAMADDVAAAACRHFDEGLYCAESVLAAVADHLRIHSPLIPSIATGFCNGVAGTWGTCGAISGGVLAINLMLGRKTGGTPVDQNYQAVRDLIHEFHCQHGTTLCSELIACDLETNEGRKVYQSNGLRQQCRQYVGTAAAISLKIIEQKTETRPDSHPKRNKNI